MRCFGKARQKTSEKEIKKRERRGTVGKSEREREFEGGIKHEKKQKIWTEGKKRGERDRQKERTLH